MQGPGTSELERGLSRARERAETHRSDHRVGGLPLRLSIIGPALHAWLARPAIPATGNGERADSRLVIEIWDESVCGVGRPAMGDGWEPVVRGWPDSFAASRGPRVRHWGADFDLLLDRRERRVVGWVRSAEAVGAVWHPARPLHPVLMPWLADHGRVVVHSGAVESEGNAAILAGGPEAGKSTSVVACGLAGLGILGDDAIAVGSGPDPQAWCVNATAKLRPEGARRFAELAEEGLRLGGRWSGDVALFATELDALAPAAEARLSAVLCPERVADPASKIRRLTGAEALVKLTATALNTSHSELRDHFDHLAALAQSLPCYALAVGTDPGRIPGAVLEALEDAG